MPNLSVTSIHSVVVVVVVVGVCVRKVSLGFSENLQLPLCDN